MPTRRIRPLPDGGYTYTYDLDDGTTATYFVPPAGFSPLNATDAQLAEYHFPSRPADADSLKDWQSLMKSYKSTPAPSVEKVNRPHRMQKSASLYSTAKRNNEIWFGVENSPSSSMKYTSVQASFKQPKKNDNRTDTYECSWVGIGGDTKYYGSSDLIQCGTEMDAKGYRLFWEKLNSSYDSGQQNVYTVSPGDSITVLTSYSLTNNYANLYLSDNTTGLATMVTTYAKQYYDGSTAEFIEERTALTSGGVTYNSRLANYGTVTWTKCKSTLSTSSKTGTYDAYYLGFNYLVMIDDTGNALSKPDPFTSSTSFTDKWYSRD